MNSKINQHYKLIFSRNCLFLNQNLKKKNVNELRKQYIEKPIIDTSFNFYNLHRKNANEFFTRVQNIKIKEKLNEYSLFQFQKIFANSKKKNIIKPKEIENKIDFLKIRPITQEIYDKKIDIKIPNNLSINSKETKQSTEKSKFKQISFENKYILPFEYQNDNYYKIKYISKISSVKTTNNFFIEKKFNQKCFKNYLLENSNSEDLKLNIFKTKKIPPEIISLEEQVGKIEKENFNLKNILLTKKNNSLNLDLEYEKLFFEYKNIEIIRKKAQEYIHNIRGNILVYCRIKPSLTKNEENSIISFPEILDDNNIESNNQVLTSIELKNNLIKNSYHFDRIFPENTSQYEIFDEIKSFIQSSLDGDNICIFAYGATGSGKTYTMQGKIEENNKNFITQQSGILPRTAKFIFEEKKRLEKMNENLDISFSAIEIYNETIYDLLIPNNNIKKIPLTIYCANNEVNIPNLQWKNIQNENDIIKFTLHASNTRSCDSTSFNSVSSRSHAIYRIKIYNNSNKKNSMINIIDLAGSERSSLKATSNLTKEEKDYIKKIQNEANFINKSLSALGRIINMIGDKKNCNKLVIPYRESKLTIVLQNYLKPNSKTIMIVNVSGENKDYNFTKESLNFATNAMVNC